MLTDVAALGLVANITVGAILVWTITSEFVSLSAHLKVRQWGDSKEVPLDISARVRGGHFLRNRLVRRNPAPVTTNSDGTG